MINRLKGFIRRLSIMHRINAGLSRAAATAPLRIIDPTVPSSWEFSGFSQNGEDGIVDYLGRQLKAPERTFVEIGAADGVENLTAWLALGLKHTGVMVEGDALAAERARLVYPGLNLGVDFRTLFVDEKNAAEFVATLRSKAPDFFSLDIDGVDYYVAQALFQGGFRPKVVAVEFNSAFGPVRSVTVPYAPDFNITTAHPTRLYYGASIAAWRNFFGAHGYRFVTVDRNGVNAFFILPEAFEDGFADNLRGLPFVVNFSHASRFGNEWEVHHRLICELPVVAV